MSLLFAACLGGMALADPLAFRTDVTVADAVIELADVADLSPLPPALRQRAASVPVGHVGASGTRLSSRDVASRARAALPGLSPWLPDETDVELTVRRARIGAAQPELQVSGEKIDVGQPLTLQVTVGPVTVEREVRALQSGQAGRALFVRTAEGVVLKVQVVAP